MWECCRRHPWPSGGMDAELIFLWFLPLCNLLITVWIILSQFKLNFNVVFIWFVVSYIIQIYLTVFVIVLFSFKKCIYVMHFFDFFRYNIIVCFVLLKLWDSDCGKKFHLDLWSLSNQGWTVEVFSQIQLSDKVWIVEAVLSHCAL